MDPTAALTELRELAATCDPEVVDRMAELFTALDQWLSRGGFLPLPWVD